MPSTTYPKGHPMTSTITVSTMGNNTDKALAHLAAHLPAGMTITGRTATKYAGRVTVMEVTVGADCDRADAWVLLTSYGLTPSDDLGAYWQDVEGVGR
jgi:hypothetical protein